MMKKTILALALILICFGISIATVNAEINEYYYKTKGDGTAEIILYTGSKPEVEIPTEIDGIRVTSVGRLAFSSSDLLRVIIPETVKEIHEYAFGMCEKLNSVVINSKEVFINNYAFYRCGELANVTIMGNLKLESEKVFWGEIGLLQMELAKEQILKQEERILAKEDQLERWIAGGKKTEEQLEKQREAIQKENDKLVPIIEAYACIDVEKVGKYDVTFLIPKNNQETINEVAQFGYSYSVIDENGLRIQPEKNVTGFKSGELYIYNLEGNNAQVYLSDVTSKEYVIPEVRDGYSITAFFSMQNYKIEKLIIPANCSLKYNVFSYLRALKSIQVAYEHPELISVEGVLYKKSPLTLLAYPEAKEAVLYTVMNGTQAIGEYAFAFCKSGIITIPDSVIQIDKTAFRGIGSQFMIVVGKNSYADNYCHLNNIQHKHLGGD